MKKVWIISVVLMISLAFAACSVFDDSEGVIDSGSCGEVEYSLDTDTGAMTISGHGSMSDYGSSTHAPWNGSLAVIKTVTIADGVAGIGNSAFRGCVNLVSVSIADSVKSIGVDAFSGCSSLESVTGGSGVTFIGKSAFYSCKSLSDISIGEKVVTIAEAAFYGCQSLKSVAIPDSVEYVNGQSFAYCKSLSDVSIGSGVKYIGHQVFYGSSSLASIAVDPENGVYSSEGGVLYNKDRTQLIIYPEGASTTCNIPYTVTSFSIDAFEGCTGLQDIVVDPANAVFSSDDGILYDKDMTHLIFCPRGSLVRTCVIPDSVSTIDDDAFNGCRGITIVIIGSGVEIIGDGAFETCSSLESITMSDSVKTIGMNAFFECWNLKKIFFGNGLISVGSNAFSEAIYDSDGTTVLSPTVDNLKGSTFERTNGLLIKDGGASNSDEDESSSTFPIAAVVAVVIVIIAAAIYLVRRNA